MGTEMKMLMSAKEYVLIACTLMLVPIFLVEIFGVSMMRDAIPEFQTNPDMPQLPDVLYGLFFALVLIALRSMLTAVFRPLGRIVLSPAKRVNEDRVERFATVLFKFLYFVIITVVGYYVIKDEEWMPALLGGKGATINTFYTINTPPSVALKYYYFVQLGYHTHSFIYLVCFSPVRNDYIEMMLHHVATMILIGGSYLANYCATGALVVFTHDIGDVTGYFIKAIVDMGKTWLTVIAYVVLLVSWAYTRLYVFPFELIYHTIYVLPVANPHIVAIFVQPGNAMMCMLVILHYYWYVLFLVMGYTLLRSGKADDIQQKIEDDDDKKVMAIKKGQ